FIPSGILFFFACSLFLGMFDLPFDLYRTFVIEKRFSFSTITFPMWLSDLVKSVLISAVIMGIFLSVFFWLILIAPKTWWLMSWIFFVSFQMLMSWLYPVVIAPLFNKFEAIDDRDLLEKISDLAGRAGITVKGIFKMDAQKRSRHSNAYFTGIGKSKRIVLFDTLIQGHTREELLSVLAHEIGHWKKGHIRKQIIMSMTVSFVLLYGAYLAVTKSVLYTTFGFSGVTIYAGLFLLSVILKPAAYLVSPLGAMISRHFERQADTYAYEQIGSAEAMVSALKQLATQNLSNLHPDPVYAWFMYSHPPLVERIRYLNGLQRGQKG
ncbi:M48 family peptidase, partial [bacterium]|nr:M48 family peptidase [bacterium]